MTLQSKTRTLWPSRNNSQRLIAEPSNKKINIKFEFSIFGWGKNFFCFCSRMFVCCTTARNSDNCRKKKNELDREIKLILEEWMFRWVRRDSRVISGARSVGFWEDFFYQLSFGMKVSASCPTIARDRLNNFEFSTAQSTQLNVFCVRNSVKNWCKMLVLTTSRKATILSI